MGIISGPIGKGLSLFKLKQATANAGDVLKGVTFFSKDKILKTGTLALSGNANAAQVLSGYTFYKDNAKSKLTGTMANKGAVSATLNPGGSYNVPAGYHNGSGKVTAKNVGVSLAGTGYTTSTSALNWSTTVSGANALLVVVYGTNMTKINTPTVSSGTVTKLSDCPYRQYNGDGSYGDRQAAFVYAVTGISGNCTIRCTTSNWDWGFGATVYKIA